MMFSRRSRQGFCDRVCVRSLAAFVGVVLSANLVLLADDKPSLPRPPSVEIGLRDDVQYLASEELRGRSVTDETIHQAARYVERRMRGIGLQMNAVGGRATQKVSILVGSDVASVETNQCSFTLPDNSIVQATLNERYGPLAVGKEKSTVTAPLVFAGYGITSDAPSYDDYARVDARGCIVMILRKEPRASDPESPFDGVRNTRHAYFATKISNALSHGAVGILFVNDPRSTRDAVQKQQNLIDQEISRRDRLITTRNELPGDAVNNRAAVTDQIDRINRIVESTRADLEVARRGVFGINDAGTKTRQSSTIPIASIARDVADQLLKAVGSMSLAEVEQQIDQTLQPASRSMKEIGASMSVDLKPAEAISDNVIGFLPGRGVLGDQSIVIGAHYDHVGMGGFASLAPGTIAVHNGADDNASGTATMLACAAVLKDRLGKSSSHRGVIFIGFTGEERGLVGSQYYVNHPIKPLANTTSMINLDMVGRLRDNELTVYGTGTGVEFDSLVDRANERFEFKLFKVASGYGPSDHQSFYRVGIPVLFFFTGLHSDYHRPSDDFDKIDFGDLTRITDMVSEVAFRLAVLPQRPRYAETGKQVQIRRQMTAYLGIVVSVQGSTVRITEVTEDGPASKAGLQIDDEIQRIGKKAVRSTSDILSWIRAHGPGDKFEIIVRRNAGTMTIRGKLGKRPL